MLILIFTCPKIDKDKIKQEREGCRMTREEAEQYLYYAMTIGEQLLCCGAEVGRVEDTIRRICLAYGATRADVFSITSSIVTTIYGEDFGICTQTRRVPGMSNDLGRLDDLNQLSRYICEYRPKPEEIRKGLEKIRDKQGYSFKTQILIYAVISGSFSVFFGGDVNDMIASALIGIALKLFEAFVKTKETVQDYEDNGIPWNHIMAYVGPKITPEVREVIDMLHERGVMCMISTAPSDDKLSTPESRAEAYRMIIRQGVDIIESDRPIEVAEAISSLIPVSSSKGKFFSTL